MYSTLPEPVEGGVAAVPQRFLLCVSNLEAIWQNPFAFSVTYFLCVCAHVYENYLPFHLRCYMDNTDMFDLFSQMLKEQWVSDAKRCWGVASPSQLLHVVQKLLSVICDQYIWS